MNNDKEEKERKSRNSKNIKSLLQLYQKLTDSINNDKKLTFSNNEKVLLSITVRNELRNKRLQDKRWKKLKTKIKKELNFKCMDCKSTKGLNVCHLFHPEDYPDFYERLAFCEKNLFLLCKSCHMKMDVDSRHREKKLNMYPMLRVCK